MHTYDRPEPSADALPSIRAFRFNDALDLVAYAELDATIGWKTWPEAWHLDAAGLFECYYKASSCDSLVRWARDPSGLYRSRREGLARGGCTQRWVIVDSRPVWLNDPPIVSEADAEAFLRVRRHLRRVGVHLLDCVVFDDDGHWWSMHELTSGTTAWAASVA